MAMTKNAPMTSSDTSRRCEVPKGKDERQRADEEAHAGGHQSDESPQQYAHEGVDPLLKIDQQQLEAAKDQLAQRGQYACQGREQASRRRLCG